MNRGFIRAKFNSWEGLKLSRGIDAEYNEFCICEDKNKANWYIMYDWRKTKGYAYIRCLKCHKMWKTKARYVDELKDKPQNK